MFYLFILQSTKIHYDCSYNVALRVLLPKVKLHGMLLRRTITYNPVVHVSCHRTGIITGSCERMGTRVVRQTKTSLHGDFKF